MRAQICRSIRLAASQMGLNLSDDSNVFSVWMQDRDDFSLIEISKSLSLAQHKAQVFAPFRPFVLWACTDPRSDRLMRPLENGRFEVIGDDESSKS